MAALVFVSYSRADQEPTDWLEKLKRYLACFRREDLVEVWDDRTILPGAPWEAEIQRALENARAAVLLVGPGFLASEFVQTRELPALIDASRRRGLRIFPLVTSYCPYEQSALKALQSVNPPGQPLESLAPADQNRILNALSIEVAGVVDHEAVATAQSSTGTGGLIAPMQELAKEFDLTGVAFRSQNTRCRDLYGRIRQRLGIAEQPEFEEFFFRYYDQLSADELFVFKQLRAVTEGPLAEGNRRMLGALLNNPALLTEVPSLTDLRQHLVFWLNKFERVFAGTPQMCVCYVGVEDGVPWPQGAEAAVRAWLAGQP